MIRLIQFGVASFLLLFSTVAALYEGSAILTNTWEWRYSTPFTQLLHGAVYNPSDISRLDYLVYAAKFQPTFPIMMLLSGLYLLILTGYYILKQKKKFFAYYLIFLSGGLLLCSSLIANSPTVGGKIMFFLFLICGISCSIAAIIINFNLFNRIRMKMKTMT